LFAIGVGLFIYDFFRHAPRFELADETRAEPATYGGEAASRA